MVGFHGIATSNEVDVDGAELVDASWFTAAELRSRISASGLAGLFRVDSIGKFLVKDWLRANL